MQARTITPKQTHTWQRALHALGYCLRVAASHTGSQVVSHQQLAFQTVGPRVLALLITSTSASAGRAIMTMPLPLLKVRGAAPATMAAAAALGHADALLEPATDAPQASEITSCSIPDAGAGAGAAARAVAEELLLLLTHWLTALTSVEQASKLDSWLSVALLFSSSCTANSRLHWPSMSAMVLREEPIHASEGRILPVCNRIGVTALTRVHWQASQAALGPVVVVVVVRVWCVITEGLSEFVCECQGRRMVWLSTAAKNLTRAVPDDSFKGASWPAPGQIWAVLSLGYL